MLEFSDHIQSLILPKNINSEGSILKVRRYKILCWNSGEFSGSISGVHSTPLGDKSQPKKLPYTTKLQHPQKKHKKQPYFFIGDRRLLIIFWKKIHFRQFVTIFSWHFTENVSEGHCLCATSEKRFWRWSLHEASILSTKTGPEDNPQKPPKLYWWNLMREGFYWTQVCFASGGQFLLFKLRRGSISEAQVCCFITSELENCWGFTKQFFFWGGATFDGRTPMQCLNVEKTPLGFIPWDFLLFSTPQNFDGIFFQQLDVCLDIFPGWNFPWSFP